MITLSLDVTLLDKAKFKRITRKNGKEAVFCDLVMIESPNSDYGDYMVKQSQTREEREAKVQTPIVGNAKNFNKAQARPASSPASTQQSEPPPPSDDDVPF